MSPLQLRQNASTRTRDQAKRLNMAQPYMGTISHLVEYRVHPPEKRAAEKQIHVPSRYNWHDDKIKLTHMLYARNRSPTPRASLCVRLHYSREPPRMRHERPLPLRVP